MINETTNIELINQISELKKENEILRLNSIYEISTIKKNYCKIFENLNDGFAFCKLIVENNIPTDFIYLEVNSAYEQLTGNNNIVSRKFTEIFPESKEKNPEIFQIYGSVALTGKAEKFEIYFNPLKIWLSVSAICPEKGYFITILVDITSKKQTEQELVESNEKFKLFTENLTDVIWIFNLTQKRFTYISPSVTQLTGFSVEEALKQSIDECLTPKSIEIINKKILILTQEFLNNPKKKITDYNEIEQICKDGSIIWIETITQPQFAINGDIEILGVSRNIDKRKHIESQLKESEKHYRRISETVPIMLYDYILYPDGNNKFLYVGPTCREILEIIDKELLSDMNLFWQMIYPDDLQRLKDEDIRANKSRDLFMSEVRIITPSGRLKWIQLSSRPNSDSEIWSGYILDITERKNSEIALKVSEDKLRILNSDKDRFMSILAHDLINPFNTLLGFSDLLLTNLHEYGIDIIEKQIKIIHQTNKKTYNLLEDLLLWSKSQSGKLIVEPQKIVVSEISNEIINILKHQADTKEISIIYFEPEKTVVTVDLNMFKTILRNLISNAIKFTNKKGQINIYTEKNHKNATITVSDNGIGIEKDNLPKLWDFSKPFSTSGTANEKGTGFGLLLCKEFVEKHGGTIWVESEIGIGSTFFFTLPYNAEPVENKVFGKDALVQDKENQIKDLKILIAEDDETSEILITINVGKFSKEILKARNGFEAVEVCRNNPDTDLILMDIQLPVMNGHEATRQIRQFNKDVVIIAQTAFGLSGDREKAIEAGCNDYISKPINKEKLLSTIQKYFNK